MSWNYRIVRYRNPEDGYGLHEVFYDDNQRVVTITETPARFACLPNKGPGGVIKYLEMALKDARERDILEAPDWFT